MVRNDITLPEFAGVCLCNLLIIKYEVLIQIEFCRGLSTVVKTAFCRSSSRLLPPTSTSKSPGSTTDFMSGPQKE